MTGIATEAAAVPDPGVVTLLRGREALQTVERRAGLMMY